MKNIFSTILIVAVLILLTPVLSHAQINHVPGNPDAPIDGGLSILIAAGVGYGVKKLREQNKKHGSSSQE
jgi:hypothetical protein